MPDVYQVCRI